MNVTFGFLKNVEFSLVYEKTALVDPLG